MLFYIRSTKFRTIIIQELTIKIYLQFGVLAQFEPMIRNICFKLDIDIENNKFGYVSIRKQPYKHFLQIYFKSEFNFQSSGISKFLPRQYVEKLLGVVYNFYHGCTSKFSLRMLALTDLN